MVTTHGYDANAVGATATSPLSFAFFDFGNTLLAYLCLWMGVPELARAANVSSSSSAAAAPVSPLIPLDAAASAAVRSRLRRSVSRYMGAGAEAPRRSGATVDGRTDRLPGAATAYELMVGGGRGLADPEWQLRRYPSSLVDWPSRNSRRLDVALSADWARAGAGVVVGSPGVLPADEALVTSIGNDCDMVMDGASNSVDGGSGRVESVPNSWLFVYWMRRYHALADGPGPGPGPDTGADRGA
jgi:hypothetical protein